MNKKYQVNRAVLLVTFMIMLLLVIWVGYYVSRLVIDADAYAWYKTVIAMVVLYFFIKLLKMPHAVTITEENTLVFQSVFAKKEVPVKELIIVTPGFARIILSFKSKDSRIAMLNRIENFKELNNSIKRRKKSAKRPKDIS